MKKIFCVVLCFICLFTCIGCGPEYAGTYKSVDNFLGVTRTIKLKGNGTFTYKREAHDDGLMASNPIGGNYTSNGTYEYDEKTGILTLTYTDQSEIDGSYTAVATGTIKNNQIVFASGSAITGTFKRV